MRTARSFLAAAIVYGCLCCCFGQQALPGSAEPGRSLHVNVIDSKGRAVRDLAKDNFSVLLDGKPATVVGARYNLAPRRIVALLDLSASMEGEPSRAKWHVATEAVKDLLSQTPADGSIALVTFGGNTRDIFDFSRGRDAIGKWLSENIDRPPKFKDRRTALFDALSEGLKLLGAVQPGDVIYAITDGGDNASQTSARQVKAALLRSDIRLFAFLLADPESRHSLPEAEGENTFLELVRDSGGFVFGIKGQRSPFADSGKVNYSYDEKNRETIEAYSQELNIQVNGFWILDLMTPPSTKAHKVRLAVSGYRTKQEDLVVTYPHMLLAEQH